MRTHPYLRAYMAGIVVPTILMVVIVTVFATWRSTIMPLVPDSPPAPTVGTVLLLEALGRAIIFPMAIVPNVWGIWNVLYLAVGGKTRVSLGLYGALLPVFLIVATGPLDIPPRVAALSLGYTLGLMGILTPYATGPAPVYYACGFIRKRDFWWFGLVMGSIFLAGHLLIGLPWLILRS